MFSELVLTISNFRRVPCSCTEYSVPPSARVIVLAAIRMFSRSRLRSFSRESAAPISFSCSRRRNRSSTVSSRACGDSVIGSVRCIALLYADRPYLGHIGDSLQHLLDAVHLQGAHAFFQADREDFRDPGVL